MGPVLYDPRHLWPSIDSSIYYVLSQSWRHFASLMVRHTSGSVLNHKYIPCYVLWPSKLNLLSSFLPLQYALSKMRRAGSRLLPWCHLRSTSRFRLGRVEAQPLPRNMHTALPHSRVPSHYYMPERCHRCDFHRSRILRQWTGVRGPNRDGHRERDSRAMGGYIAGSQVPYQLILLQYQYRRCKLKERLHCRRREDGQRGFCVLPGWADRVYGWRWARGARSLLHRGLLVCLNICIVEEWTVAAYMTALCVERQRCIMSVFHRA